MTFAEPKFLYSLILVPLMGLFVLWASRRKAAALAQLGDPSLLAQLSAHVNRRGRRWRTALWFIALTAIIIALARPQWGTEVQTVEQQGIEIMVALDVSKSMLAEDIKPNRLTRAKLEISDLMDKLAGDEMGLVLFSGASFIQFPLTSDFTTARTFLDAAGPQVISRPGTAIGDAIRTALAGFDETRASQRVIIIMTDGEDHNSNPLDAAKDAAAQGVIIFTIGFGSPDGNPIPEFNDAGEVVGYKKNANGETVISKLDEVTLQKIALATGGEYFRASAGGNELDALSKALAGMKKAKLESQFETRHIERFQWFVAVALLALIAAELIPERASRRET